MTPPVWVLDDTVRALHEQLLAEFGGAAGVRDEGLLASALARPRNRQAYAPASLCQLAASYAFGLVRNHPFIDGNKRIGFATAVLFLELNGRAFEADEVDAVLRTLALATGDLDEAGYAAWLDAKSIQRRSPP